MPHGGLTRPACAPPRARRRAELAGAAAVFFVLLSASGCGREGPVTSPESGAARPGKSETGVASWYGPNFHGRTTASGERYNMFEYTAAHRSLPFGTKLRVKNLENGKTVSVRVNDRGPFKKRRILDLSYVAARDLGITRHGTARVRIEVVAPG